MPRVVLRRHRRRPQLVLCLLRQRQGRADGAMEPEFIPGRWPFLSDQTSIAARSWPRLVRVGKNRLMLP